MCPMCPIWAHFRAQSWAQLVTIFSKYHRVWWYVICTTSTTKTINSTKCGVVRFWENLWIYHNIWKVRYNEKFTSCTSLKYNLRYIVRYILLYDLHDHQQSARWDIILNQFWISNLRTFFIFSVFPFQIFFPCWFQHLQVNIILYKKWGTIRYVPHVPHWGTFWGT